MTVKRLSGRVSAALALAVMALALSLGMARLVAGSDDAVEGHADVVAHFGNGVASSRRITFTQPGINGLEALRRAYAIVDSGGGVCSISGIGDAASACFGQYPLYWNYLHREAGVWQSSLVGPASYTLTASAVEGWIWSSGTLTDTRKLLALTPEMIGAQAAAQWLGARVAANGSFGGVGTTIDSILALRAAGVDMATVRQAGGASPLQFLQTATNTLSYASIGAAQAGKLALGLAAADLDPLAYRGASLPLSITAFYNAGSGAYGASNWDQAFAMLGLSAAGEAVPMTATHALAARIMPDGGWGFSPGGKSDSNSTGLVMQALIAGGYSPTATEILSAVAYLDARQNGDGGFGYGTGDPSDANSTALAVQGLLAAGLDPYGSAFTTLSATNPISFLLTQQQPDGGLVYLAPPSNLLATVQALPALHGHVLPFASRAVSARKAAAFILSQQKPDGSFAGFGVGSSIDAVLALAAAGENPRGRPSGVNAFDFMLTVVPTYPASSAAAAGKLVVAVTALGGDPRNFGGLNLVLSVTQRYDAGAGQYGSSVWDQSWSMLALAAVRAPIPIDATARLSNTAASGGGWGSGVNASGADAGSTGLALMAMKAAGATLSHPAVRQAMVALDLVQLPDGGFNGFGASIDASSTGLASQGLAAFDIWPRNLAWQTATRPQVRTPLDALLALQSPRGGFAGFSGPDDTFSTYQGLPGVLGRAFPTRVRADVWLPWVSR